MADHLTPQQVLDLACQAQPQGDSLQALRLHLAGCAACRRSLLEAEALQALAVEAAPEMDQAANRALAADAGRQALRQQISEQAGEEAAHQLMDEPPAASRRGASMAPALAALAAALLLGGLLWWQNRREQQAMAELAAPAWPGLDATPAASAAPSPAQPFVPPTPLPAGLRDSGTDKAPTAADRAAKRLLISHSRAASKKRRHAAAKKPSAAALAKPAVPAATALPAPSPEPSPTAGGGPLAQALVQAPGGLDESGDPSQQPASLEVVSTRCAPAQHQLAQLAVVAPGPAQVELRIFTIHSRSVRAATLELAQAGRLELSWNGQDDQGVDLPAGIYYARVTTPWFIRTETLELAR
jgi:hypothetical protein